MFFDMKFNMICDANGDATVVADVAPGPWWPGPCYLRQVILDFGTLDANMDISITTTKYGATITHFTKTDQGAADAIWYPLLKAHDGVDASALADGDGGAYRPILLSGPPSVIVADGGNVQVGEIYLIVDVIRK